MHEMSIAAAIVEQVLAVAKENNLSKVTQVRLRVGALRLIVPEALAAAWEAVRDGTPAGLACLQLIEVAARARCRKCGHEFLPDWPVFLCPACEQASVEILAGEELVLEEIVGEDSSRTERIAGE
jgi:hydrogenase nickel incorporation protein HypA/HybF